VYFDEVLLVRAGEEAQPWEGCRSDALFHISGHEIFIPDEAACRIVDHIVTELLAILAADWGLKRAGSLGRLFRVT
jgi:hypothetical protein